MELSPEEFNKLVTKDEFYEFKEDMDEKMNIMISMLKKNSTKDKDHDIEHVSNIAAHDRFHKEIEQIKNQIQAPANA